MTKKGLYKKLFLGQVSILGAGESGMGAAVLASSRGISVYISDLNAIPKDKKQFFEAEKIVFDEQGHDLNRILSSTVVVASPGIPFASPIIQKIKERDIPIISDIELGYLLSTKPIIAVTGTNGKSTTVKAMEHLLSDRKRVSLSGNYGNSFCMEVVRDEDIDYYVLEVSSFQLEGCIFFKPWISVITNITPDHMNRYSSFEEYRDVKLDACCHGNGAVSAHPGPATGYEEKRYGRQTKIKSISRD